MATTQNITVDQGTSLAVTFTLKNPDNSAFDLTSYTAELQVRPTYPGSVLIDASTTNGKLVISAPATGILVWNIAAADTPQTISFGHGEDAALVDSLDFIYDLKITAPSGSPYRPVEGTFTVNRAVTHP
jgi:hypothetical protein